MNWRSGLIFKVKNYKFEDDNTTRDKYAIVLYANGNEAFIIHSLTTSQNNLNVPGNQFGCNVHQRIPYYFFPAMQVIGDADFFFEKDTFIFFRNNVRKTPVSKFSNAATLPFGLVDLGCLASEELKRLLKCVLKSTFVPASIEKELRGYKDSL